ncbi:hypothetical protein [Deinococcus apachensis]|uniref:hypothetical protein n=1 Tax=Deinococcus apachensis TaxID=309886 RepID=UPI0003752389|nr:hypothetical protein [Deinococcus apachensis]
MKLPPLLAFLTCAALAAPQPQPPAAPQAGRPASVDYNDISMMISLTGISSVPTVERLGKRAVALLTGPPHPRMLIPLTSLRELGCETRYLSSTQVRVSCPFPALGPLYTDVAVVYP